MAKTAGRLKWQGSQAQKEIEKTLSDALVEITLAGEQMAKEQLYPGRGYDTGTLQRSLHSADPDYNWRSDNMPRSINSPERGGGPFTPKIEGHMIRGAFGSGMGYAIWVHQGHRSFPGYHYIIRIVPTLQRISPQIVGKHAKRRRAT